MNNSIFDNVECVELQSSECIYSHVPDDVYLIKQGSVLIYIVPWKNNMPGRRVPLCEMHEGKMIPSLAYRDADYGQWRFAIAAKEDSVIHVIKGGCTSALKQKFVANSGISISKEESFEVGIVECYKRELLKDNVFIVREKRETSEVNAASYGVIRQVFDDNSVQGSSKDALYNAVVFACKKSRIPIIGVNRLHSYCGRRYSVEDIAQASHFLFRKIVLDSEWHKQDCGTIISDIDGVPVSCVRAGIGKYTIYRSDSGEVCTVTDKVAATVNPKAYSIGRILPERKLTKKDLFAFGLHSVSYKNLILVILLGLVGTLIGLLLPTLNQEVHDNYIPVGDFPLLVQFCVLILSFMIGNLMFSAVKRLTEFLIASHVSYDLQNALYHRVFRLPEGTLRKYDSADMAGRLMSAATIAREYTNVFVVTFMSTVFSLLYLFKMIKYSGKLTGIAALVIIIYALINVWLSSKSLKYDRIIEQKNSEASSKLFQFLCGIDKIRMAGAEDRAIYEYLVPFSATEMEEIKKNRWADFNTALAGVSSFIFSIVLYLIIVKKNINVSIGSFIAFNTAFGTLSSSLLQFIDGLMKLFRMKPKYERLKPILDTYPEDDTNKALPGKLSGSIAIEHVSFAYDKESPNVLQDLCLNIEEGEYVGIVGESGCGKSTLFRMLLGFEKPNSGKIYYDGKDLDTLDKHMVRKNIGAVLQNGRLIAGSIFENITITSPDSTIKDVNRVIEAVGLKEDIDQMPMGVHTMLSEDAGTISGGQQQRILIARAIINDPSILLFDEATSALDNITQAMVCESLDKMNATRIVIAHRLSTVRNCDRILVLSRGKIAESGNYDELMEKKGLFYHLAIRQITE